MKKLWLIVPLFIGACQDQIPTNTQIVEWPDTLSTKTSNGTMIMVRDTSKANGIQLQTFQTIPAEVNGCSGLFKLASCETNCNYVFATNLQGKAFVKIDDKVIALVRQNKRAKAGSFHEVYKANDYKVEIEVNEVRQLGEELTRYEGLIKIIRNGVLQEHSVVGEIGC